MRAMEEWKRAWSEVSDLGGVEASVRSRNTEGRRGRPTTTSKFSTGLLRERFLKKTPPGTPNPPNIPFS